MATVSDIGTPTVTPPPPNMVAIASNALALGSDGVPLDNSLIDDEVSTDIIFLEIQCTLFSISCS